MRVLSFAGGLCLHIPAALFLAGCTDPPAGPTARPTSTSSTGSPRPVSPGALAAILAVHNRERAAIGASRVEWDDQLAADATAYAAELARKGRFEHAPVVGRRGQGENLWMGTAGGYEPEQMVAGWAGEKKLFRPGRFPNVSKTGKWADVGHYTQMIWARTTRIGCGTAHTEYWDYLVCRYAPPGNVIGQQVP